MTHPIVLHLSEMKKKSTFWTKLTTIQAQQPKLPVGGCKTILPFMITFLCLLLGWTTKAKHNLLNAAKSSDEDQTLADYC